MLSIVECVGVLLFGFAVATEHFFDLVDVEFFHQVACWTAVFTWVEFSWLFSEHLANSSGECQTRVAIDVDFANSALSSLAELFFWNTYSVRKCAAVSVDDVNVFLWN